MFLFLKSCDVSLPGTELPPLGLTLTPRSVKLVINFTADSSGAIVKYTMLVCTFFCAIVYSLDKGES